MLFLCKTKKEVPAARCTLAWRWWVFPFTLWRTQGLQDQRQRPSAAEGGDNGSDVRDCVLHARKLCVKYTRRFSLKFNSIGGRGVLIDAMELHLILRTNDSLHDVALIALFPLSLDTVTRRNEDTHGLQSLLLHHIHNSIVSVPHSL